ncbi:hypothetical protein evm_011553 [Chilo suppressalis]|nr:hypothetical protein evm_011553 [Chilo suppressalis]
MKIYNGEKKKKTICGQSGPCLSVMLPQHATKLTLVGSRTHDVVQQFIRFKLTLEPLGGRDLHAPSRLRQFQLFADTLTSFDDECVTAVLEADDLPKTEVQVMWKAPPAGSGCVLLNGLHPDGGGPRAAWLIPSKDPTPPPLARRAHPGVLVGRAPPSRAATEPALGLAEWVYSFKQKKNSIEEQSSKPNDALNYGDVDHKHRNCIGTQ